MPPKQVAKSCTELVCCEAMITLCVLVYAGEHCGATSSSRRVYLPGGIRSTVTASFGTMWTAGKVPTVREKPSASVPLPLTFTTTESEPGGGGGGAGGGLTTFSAAHAVRKAARLNRTAGDRPNMTIKYCRHVAGEDPTEEEIYDSRA